jgi:hypothetical protein
MVRLGWGTPTILRLDLAIMLDLPEPVRVILLGRLRVALPPTDGDSIIVVNLDSVGVLDFGRGEVSLDAMIYDSQIAAFALSGEMALRARWKDDPTFVLAVGGFHPAFSPPPGFPKLARIALSLGDGDNPRLRLESYFAVTSNTIQLGARVELHAEAAGFAADGQLAFDALVYFDPFGLQADFVAQVSITFESEVICSASLEVHLTGPSPWHVRGRASFSVLFISGEVDFDEQIGTALPPPPIPAIHVQSRLLEALAAPANWTALPPSGETVVTLRSAPERSGIYVHPLGGLTPRQRIVPLGVTLETFGAAPIDGPDRFALEAVRIGSLEPDERADVSDSFAPAQFFQLSDAEKLSRPAFETFTSGSALRFTSFDVDEKGAGEAASLEHEVVLVDAHADGRLSKAVPDAKDAATLAHAGPAGRAQVRRTGRARFSGKRLAVEVVPRRYSVVDATDALSGECASARSFTEAAEALRKARGKVPKRLAVVPRRRR